MAISEDIELAGSASPPLDRRARRRFTIQLPLSGTVLEQDRRPIKGTTLNISSKGILFAAVRAIPAGARVRIVIDWPTPEGGEVKLVLLGRIVRSLGNLIAAQVCDHQFQTSSKTITATQMK